GHKPGIGRRVRVGGRARTGGNPRRRTDPDGIAALRAGDAALHRSVPATTQRHRRLSTEVGQRYRSHSPGHEVDAALAISAFRRPELVRSRRSYRAAGVFRLARPITRLDSCGKLT